MLLGHNGLFHRYRILPFVCISHYFDGFSNKNGIVDYIFLGVTGVIFKIMIYFSLKRLFLFVCLI